MAEYKVKWFASEMQGAPSLGDTAEGALAALLKAVLVTGFGTLTINALAFDAAKGWAVATFTGGHAYLQDSVVQVEGVSPAAYNGEHRVMQVTATQVWFEIDGGNPGAPGTGAAMTMKVAPLGWTITHESGDGKIFIVRPTNVSESGNVSWRFDNTAFSGWTGSNAWGYGAYFAKVSMVEDVVDINTYTTILEHRWPATQRYSAKVWDFVGDNQMLYWLPATSAASYQAIFCMGYIRTIRPGDRYHAVLCHSSTTNAGDNSISWGVRDQPGGTNNSGTPLTSFDQPGQKVIARPYHQLFGSTSWWLKGLFGRFGNGLSVPNGSDNGFYFSTDPIMVIENGNHLRGYMPGFVVPYGDVIAWHRKNFGDLPALPGKKVRFIRGLYQANIQGGDPRSLIGFDIIGPWR
ncbi:TPA: hypothetical protein F3L11_12810 [Aeromonas hydrophila]|uniref:hypothetical protein n=1 Tax=Aeromonas hydrophila TaxID=644 RepID=UPI00083C99D4|nr:hypothetical protein [Aeromonas hydrophila]OCY06416.1 hypothetical protein A9X69_12665 [Aeromonas hydrophila]OCY09627.1 hypothetical protein A9X70_08825 [Aeromonas hydrophila]HAU4875854.1 hypothetical protein [Aeromonas hydrophila]HAU4920630.1 hypothetical protein [Aeromonas hydrophila]